MNTQETIYNTLLSINESIGTISTVNEEGKPEVATIYFICDINLDIFFVTRSQSRKYKNIIKNPNVAFVISSEHPPKTIQIEGVASEVVDPQEQIDYFKKLVAKATESNFMPPVTQMVEGEMVFMKIIPRWARLGDFTTLKEGEKFVEVSLN